MRRSLFVAAAIAAVVSPGCRHEAKTLTASCAANASCTDYYGTMEPIVQAACARNAHGTWQAGKPCDGSSAIVGCNHGDHVEWFRKQDGEPVEWVKAYSTRMCSDRGRAHRP